MEVAHFQCFNVVLSLRSTEVLCMVTLTVEVASTWVRPSKGRFLGQECCPSHNLSSPSLSYSEIPYFHHDQKQEIVEFRETFYSRRAWRLPRGVDTRRPMELPRAASCGRSSRNCMFIALSLASRTVSGTQRCSVNVCGMEG